MIQMAGIVATFIATRLALFAADATGGFGDILDKWGFPIALVVALMVGRFVPGFLHDRLYKEKQAADAEVKRLSDAAMERVIPAVLAATEANRQVVQVVLPAIQESTRVTQEAARLLTEIAADQRARDRGQ